MEEGGHAGSPVQVGANLRIRPLFDSAEFSIRFSVIRFAPIGVAVHAITGKARIAFVIISDDVLAMAAPTGPGVGQRWMAGLAISTSAVMGDRESMLGGR